MDHQFQPHAKLYDYVEQTRVEERPNLVVLPGHDTYVASECHQPGGSFKVRGAVNYLLSSGEEYVVTASAGSFAAGLGYAARALDRRADVLVPTSTPERKIELARSFGAHVLKYGDDYPKALQSALARAETLSIPYVSPYDDAAVIAGARSLARDVLLHWPDTERTLYVPIGGGGLMAGALLAAAENENTRVVGVQYAHHNSAENSVHANRLVAASGELDTACEGSAVRQIGQIPFDIMQMYREKIDGFVTVSKQEVGESLWQEMLLREKLVPPYSHETAYDGMPETTALVAEAGMRKWMLSGRATQGAHVAVRTGGNTDQDRERLLLDAYRSSLVKTESSHRKIFCGPHVA